MSFPKVAAPTPQIASNSSNARRLLNFAPISHDALGISRLDTSQSCRKSPLTRFINVNQYNFSGDLLESLRCARPRGQNCISSRQNAVRLKALISVRIFIPISSSVVRIPIGSTDLFCSAWLKFQKSPAAAELNSRRACAGDAA